MRTSRRLSGARCWPVVWWGLLGFVLSGCTATVDGTPGSVPLLVTIEPAPGWTSLTAQAPDLQRAADAAMADGHAAVSQLLAFYAGTGREYSDVSSAVVAEAGTGLLVVREQYEVDTPLAELVHRTVDDPAAQDVTLTLAPATVAGREAWRVEQPTGDPGLAHVEFWFDHHGRRWTLEVLAPPTEIDRLASAVRLGYP